MESGVKKASRRSFIKKTAHTGIAAVAFPFLNLGLARAADKVRIGYLPVNVMLPVYSQKAEFWKKAGLDVELFRAQGGPAILQALLTGDVPVGDVGVAPAIVAASRGFPFYFLTLASVCTPKHPLDRIMVSKESPIKTFKDLRGKTLAINQKGTQPDAVLGAAEKVFGLSKSEINIIPIPYPNMPQVLAQGQVDAIYPFPPADTVAEQQGARTIAETTDLVPYIGFTTLAVRRDYADANPAVIKKLIKGAIVGQRWINDHPEESRAVANEFLGIPANIGAKVRTAYWARNALPIMANVWHLYELQVAGGIIKASPDPARMMQSYFIDPVVKFTLPALEEVGMQPDPVMKQMLNASYPLLPKPAGEYQAKWEKELLRL
jgi:NitT/TauT family transport system substrate-binding protein